MSDNSANQPPSVEDAVNYAGFKSVVAVVALMVSMTAGTMMALDPAPDKTVYRLVVVGVGFVIAIGIAVHMRGSIDGYRKGARATSDRLMPIIEANIAHSAEQLGTIREQAQRIADLLGEVSRLKAENGRLRAELGREIDAESAVHGEHPDQATLTDLSNDAPHGRGRGGIVGI